jgi:hypothetical protein
LRWLRWSRGYLWRRRLLVRRPGGGGSLFGGLRFGLLLLRVAKQIAGQNQQTGTNKAS